MKKRAIAILAVLMALVLASCGTFTYNIKKYVDIPEYSSVKVAKSAIDKAVKDGLDNLTNTYKGVRTVTEGTIAEGLTAYIYYAGTLVLFDGDVTIKVGESGIKGFDEALEAEGAFKDGKAEFELKLADDYKTPAFITAAKEAKAEESESESEEPASEAEETETATESAPAATAPVNEEEDASAETPTADGGESSYYAGKTITVVAEVEGKEGAAKAGEDLTMKLRMTLPGFEGGTYNAETKAETDKKEGDEKGFAFVVGETSFIDGFKEGLIGLSVAANTKTTLHLTFPNPYTNDPGLSNEDVDFDVTVLKVTESYTRDLDNADHFAELKADYEEKNGEGSFDYADKAALTAEYEKNAKQNQAANALVAASKIKHWPLKDLRTYETNVTNYYRNYFYSMFGQSLTDSQIAGYMGMSYEDYKQQITDTAGSELKRDLVLYQVAKDQGLTNATNEEINAYAEKLAGESNSGFKNGEELLKSAGKENVKKQLVLERALEALPGLITIE